MDWCGGSTNGSLSEPLPQGHLLIGPPGSGKSSLAGILAPLLPARVISNDALRQHLWGSENVQGPWSELSPWSHRQRRRCWRQRACGCHPCATQLAPTVDAPKPGGATHSMDWLVVANTVGSVPGLEPLPPTIRSRGHDSCDALQAEQPPNRPEPSEGFTSLSASIPPTRTSTIRSSRPSKPSIIDRHEER